MLELLGFISYLITLYVYIIIAGAVMSWLIAFNVINPYNQFVRALWQGLNALTEPVLRPIRRYMPDLGGIDISPLVLISVCSYGVLTWRSSAMSGNASMKVTLRNRSRTPAANAYGGVSGAEGAGRGPKGRASVARFAATASKNAS